MYHCEECGFTYDLDLAGGAPEAIADGVAEFAGLFLAGRISPRFATRPDPATWSPLEYGCHLRDVLLVQRERVLLARRVTEPAVDTMGRDERVEYDGYAGQDPVHVADQLTEAARLLANVLDRLGPDDWERTVVYHYPEPTVRTLRWVAVHTQHEVRHHLLDVTRQLS